MRIIDSIKRDYALTCTFVGYLKRRLLEKATWVALSGAVIAANGLQPTYAAASIVIALVVALVPTP